MYTYETLEGLVFLGIILAIYMSITLGIRLKTRKKALKIAQKSEEIALKIEENLRKNIKFGDFLVIRDKKHSFYKEIGIFIRFIQIEGKENVIIKFPNRNGSLLQIPLRKVSRWEPKLNELVIVRESGYTVEITFIYPDECYEIDYGTLGRNEVVALDRIKPWGF